MMENLLRKYAKLAVEVGANVNKDQVVVISCPVVAYDFARLLTEECYRVGAKEVIVNWSDSPITRLHYLNMTTDRLKTMPEHVQKRFQYYMDEKVCSIHVNVSYPGLMADVDSKKLQEVNIALNSEPIIVKYHDYSMKNETQWTIVAYPSQDWANKVFPDQKPEEALGNLWKAIFDACRISDDNDPIALWQQHMKNLAINNKKLNDYNFKSLHFKNSLGTDLEVGLVENHIWAGGQEKALNGIKFAPNMPTEETFTMPHKYQVNGIVYATKPLSFQQKLIKDFYLVFKDGAVVDFDAKEEKETLSNLINLDEGSKYLGEVALIAHDSPISNTNILFFNTLFDENASCHLALGASYPTNVKNGPQLNNQEKEKIGSNVSKTHNDFMFGSADMEVIGTTQDGKKIPVFKNGNFVI